MDITGILWDPSNNKKQIVTPYNKIMKNNRYVYPEQLTPKQLNQINKVYNTCIHPTQFLPQQFTQANALLILRAGVYAAEVHLPIEQYSVIEPTSTAQFCRHKPVLSMIIKALQKMNY